MSREHAISVEGSVVELMPGNRFRVKMPNGHHIVARLAGKLCLALERVRLGDRVQLEVSPYDMSQGLIVERKEN